MPFEYDTDEIELESNANPLHFPGYSHHTTKPKETPNQPSGLSASGQESVVKQHFEAQLAPVEEFAIAERREANQREQLENKARAKAASSISSGHDAHADRHEYCKSCKEDVKAKQS